jgi:PAS domain-containing protein
MSRAHDQVRLPEAKVLVAAVRELARARNLEDVQSVVRRAARELTGADGATFVLRDGAECVYADEDAIAPLWKGRRFAMSDCISGWVMLNRSCAVIEDIYADARIPADAYRPTFVESLAMVPICQPEPRGAIGIYWARRHKSTSSELELLQALADSTSIAMERVTAGRPTRSAEHGRRGSSGQRCRNLYAFVRYRLGPEVSDREIARRWGMSWRSFVNLKEGSRRVPRVEELEALAELLGIDAMLVLLVARGEPADVVNHWLLAGNDAVRAALLARLEQSGAGAKDIPLHSSLERIPWGVFTTDMKGRIEDLNSRFVSILGAEVRTVVGANLADFVSAGSCARLRGLQTHALEKGEAGPEQLLLENGSMAALSMVRIDGRDGKPIGFQCAAQPAAVSG